MWGAGDGEAQAPGWLGCDLWVWGAEQVNVKRETRAMLGRVLLGTALCPPPQNSYVEILTPNTSEYDCTRLYSETGPLRS